MVHLFWVLRVLYWLEDNMEWSKDIKNVEFIEKLKKLKATSELMLEELAKQKEQLLKEKEDGELGK